MAMLAGLEPTTKWLTATCSTAELQHQINNGGADGDRTHDPLIDNQRF